MTTIDPDEEQTVHEGPRFTIMRGRFGERTREWVRSPDSVAVVAYDDEQVFLVRQPREAIGRRDVLEVPAGLMDVEGESALETAQRELVEEIGMRAGAWLHATTFFSSVGFSDEQVHVFLASDLERVGEPDATGEEQIELVPWPLERLDELIDGIVDAKTLVGLLWLRRAQLDEDAPAR